MIPADPAAARPRIEAASGPRVYATHVEFHLDDPLRRLAAVRLWQEVGVPGDLLDLRRQGGDPELVDGMFLQSGSFFARDRNAHERWFPRFAEIVAAVAVLHVGDSPGRPVPTAMTCGSVEENLENNRWVARSLAAQGYPVTLSEVPDAHNYTAWRDAFAPDLADLVSRVAAP